MSAPSYYKIEPGEKLKLYWQAPDNSESLYPKATIKDVDDSTITTVDLEHESGGNYTGTTTSLTAKGLYTAQIIIYTNAARTNESSNDQRIVESIRVAYGYKPSFGQAEASVSSKQIDQIRKPLEELLEKILEELQKKSEFDPAKQKVLTDIKPTSFRGLKEELTKKFESVLTAVKSIKFDDSGIREEIELQKQLQKQGISEIDDKMDAISSVMGENISKATKKLSGGQDKIITGIKNSTTKIEKIGNTFSVKIKKLKEIVSNIKTQGIIDAVKNCFTKKDNEINKTLILKSQEKIDVQINAQISKILSVLASEFHKINNSLIGNDKTVAKSKEIKTLLGELEKISKKFDENDQLTENLNVANHNRNGEIKKLLNELFTTIAKAITEIQKKQPDMGLILQAQEKLLKTRNEFDEL